jgi:molybdenum cofactor cytidylyltransferase
VVSAIVLAAGRSTRMGRFKPLLPFNDWTVIEQIVSVLVESPVAEVLVITGHDRVAVEQRLAGWPVRAVFNPRYGTGEMLSSIQAGLQAAAADAALIALGDQPALERSVVVQIVSAYEQGLGSIIFPSYQMRRGHPLLVGQQHWADILALGEQQTLREFFKGVARGLYHVEAPTASVLQDMDTPADYQRALEDDSSRRQANQ